MSGLLAITAVLTFVPADAKKPTENPAAPPKLLLQDKRNSPTDLKLSGDLSGAAVYAGRYLAYSELMKLPQVTFTVTDDANFPGKVEISGVYLDELMHALNIPGKNTLVAAICNDEYEAHYSDEYREAHHPILVLAINGKQPALANRTGDAGSYGPYLISHASFTPLYRTLAHTEEAQIPNGVLELRFSPEDQVFHAIQPRGDFAAGSPQMQGYQIARENCFRCHNAGPYGGHKAVVTWSSLARTAGTKPGYFTAYIKDPQSENAYAQMPGFPEYDDATLAALTAYFQVAPRDQGSK
ncbi:MAG TPA: cytochrome c [Silvibacterium sp.]|nr:cytochrome c [Silvibacterium sp.]